LSNPRGIRLLNADPHGLMWSRGREPAKETPTMNATDFQDALMNILESAAEAHDEVEGDDDDSTLADLARDMADEIGGGVRVDTFNGAMLLTSNLGLVLRTASGDEFQITIVQSRAGTPATSDANA
jgi:hypothetical protein